MAMAAGWAYYYHIRPTSDHMDTLRLYHGYKHYWDKHRIPGETVRNEVLWEDPWWKRKQLMRLQTRGATRSLPPLHSRKQKRTGLSSAASANSSSTILTSKSLPAKIAAQNGTKQNGTQTELISLPNIVKKGGKDTPPKEVSLPSLDANTDKDTDSIHSAEESKLPPVVAKENTT